MGKGWRFLGVDPGVNGGLALIDEAGRVHFATKMPATERDVLEAFIAASNSGGEAVHGALERVSASPQMGVVSAFTFGRGYGALLMAFTAVTIPFDLVTPAKWQAALGCLSRGDKNVTKRRAQQLFPEVRVTHAVADALLLAEYCRRQRFGEHGRVKRG